MFLLIVFCCGTPPPCLKVIGWGVRGGVAHEILVSGQGPMVLGLGLKGLVPGLDNMQGKVRSKLGPEIGFVMA